jgi:hypothetical protein
MTTPSCGAIRRSTDWTSRPATWEAPSRLTHLPHLQRVVHQIGIDYLEFLTEFRYDRARYTLGL